MKYPTLSEKDLAGLPPELLKELSQKQPQPRTTKMRVFMNTFTHLPDTFSVDQALIINWTLTGEVITQIAMRGRLDKLAKEGVIQLHPTIKKVFVKVSQ